MVRRVLTLTLLLFSACGDKPTPVIVQPPAVVAPEPTTPPTIELPAEPPLVIPKTPNTPREFQIGVEVEPPPGWKDFCKRNPNDPGCT